MTARSKSVIMVSFVWSEFMQVDEDCSICALGCNSAGVIGQRQVVQQIEQTEFEH